MVFTKKSEVYAELKEEKSQNALNIEGEIPSWLSGTLIRNGPINVRVNGQKNAHLFDGLSMLHAFSFQEGSVVYTNKFLRSKAYHTVFASNTALAV